MTFERLKDIAVEGFEGADRERRRKLFLKLEFAVFDFCEWKLSDGKRRGREGK